MSKYPETPGRSNRSSTSRAVIAIFLILALIAQIFALQVPAARAALDQWETITPAGTSGYAFNAVAAFGNYVLLGTDHGVYKSTDRGQSWTQINTGLGSLDVRSLAIGWIFDGSAYFTDENTLVFAGTSGGIYQATLGGSSWTSADTGLADTTVRALAFDIYKQFSMDATTLYAGTAGASASGVYRTDDSGSNWSLKDAGMAGETIRSLDTCYDFSTEAYAYAISGSNKLYYSYMNSLSMSDEAWAEIYDGGTTTLNEISTRVPSGTLALMATDSGILSGGIAGDLANWTPVNDGLTNTDARSVASDFTDPQIAYAATGGGIFKTIDGAVSWTAINKHLPETGLNKVRTIPSDSTTVYALGNSGVYILEQSSSYSLPVATDAVPPAAIDDFTASEVSTSTATLAWTAPGDDNDTGTAASYDIRSNTVNIDETNWATSSALAGEPAPLAAGQTQSYTATGLSSSTTYYFAIKTTDDEGNVSGISNVTSATTDSGADATPPVISLVAAINISTSSATITWDTNEPADSQVDYGATAGYGAQSVLDPALVTSHAVLISGLTPGSTYHFRARSRDASNNLATSSDDTLQTSALPDTTAPVLAQVTPVPSPTNDPTPDYAFSTTEAGTITYGGSCTAAATNAATGTNTVTFSSLGAGTYSNCTITVTDGAGNPSAPLAVSAFTIDLTAPTRSNGSPTGTLAIGTTQAALTLTTSENATCKFATSAGTAYAAMANAFATTGTTTHSTTVTSLANGQAYSYYVRCQDTAGNVNLDDYIISFSIASDTTAPVLAQVTPVPSPTNDPTPDYAFSTTEAGTITYGGSCTAAATNAATGTNTVTFSSLGAGTYSNCTITVTDGAGNPSAPLAVSAFTIDLTAPNVLQVTQVASPTNDTTPDYVFSSSEAGTIQYGGDCSAPTASAASGNNTITFSTLTEGVHSNCTIRVTDAAGNQSTQLSVTPFTIDITLPVISNVASQNAATTSITISWNTDEPATTQIEYGLDTNYGTYSPFVSTPTTTHSVLLAGLATSTTYYYRVISRDEAYNTASSGGHTFMTTSPGASDGQAPSVPAGLSASAVSTSQINLSWNASSDNTAVAGYRIFRNGTPLTTTAATSYQDAGLSAGTPYSYTVAAYDAANNESIPCAAVSATTNSASSGGGGGGGGSYTPPADTTPPARPDSFHASTTGSQYIFSWKNPADSDFKGVVILRKEGGVPASQTDGTRIYDGKSENIAITNPDPTKQYYYRIFSYDNAGNYNAGASVLIGTVAGIKIVDEGDSGSGSSTVPANGGSGSNSGTSTPEIKEYKHLAGLASQVVEQASRSEADAVYGYNKAVALSATEKVLYDKTVARPKSVLSNQGRYAVAYFIHSGTPSTKRLGSGERAGVIGSYYAAYAKLPDSVGDWMDAIKIANGRWPAERSSAAENRAKTDFKKTYMRADDPKNNKDSNALMIMTYGLRPVIRNTSSEKAAIAIFKAIYRKHPQSSAEWDVMRAIAYGGTKR